MRGSVVAAMTALTAAVAASLAAIAWAQHGPSLSGHLGYETLGYPDDERSVASWENFFELKVRGEGGLPPRLRWLVEARVVADDASFTAGAFSPRNEERRRSYLDLVYAALAYGMAEDVELYAGKLPPLGTAWSIMDELQPANLVAPRDESDPFRRLDLGVYGVAARYDGALFFADLVFVPFLFTPVRLPQRRWSIVPAGVAVRRDLPAVDFDESQAALRLGARLSVLDLALIGYVGRDVMPIFLPDRAREGEQIRVVEHAPRLRAGGLNASLPVGERVLCRAELVYFSSPDRNRENFFHTTVAADLMFEHWIAVVGYFRDDRVGAAGLPGLNAGERRFFQSFLFSEIRYDAGGRLRARVRGGYDLTERFWIAQPEAAYRLVDRPEVELAVVGDLIDGRKAGTYFHAIRHEDRVGVRLRWYF